MSASPGSDSMPEVPPTTHGDTVPDWAGESPGSRPSREVPCQSLVGERRAGRVPKAYGAYLCFTKTRAAAARRRFPRVGCDGQEHALGPFMDMRGEDRQRDE
jgi:hypothetical protein